MWCGVGGVEWVECSVRFGVVFILVPGAGAGRGKTKEGRHTGVEPTGRGLWLTLTFWNLNPAVCASACRLLYIVLFAWLDCCTSYYSGQTEHTTWCRQRLSCGTGTSTNPASLSMCSSSIVLAIRLISPALYPAREKITPIFPAP